MKAAAAAEATMATTTTTALRVSRATCQHQERERAALEPIV
jgi:hypothetical protein